MTDPIEEHFDEWLADAAAKMEIMDRKAKERDLIIRALVLASGGKIVVPTHAQIDAMDATLIVEDWPSENAKVFSTQVQERGAQP